jgi:hypothetical protein
MISTGGYFGLELAQGEEYHKKAIRLNTGRNALEYILRAKRYKKIYLPYFTCQVLIQPIKKLKLDVEFYSLDENLEPIFNYNKINKSSAFVYTNYFGLKDDVALYLKKKCPNLIIDNAHAFFSKPMSDIDTFYSARKFFGVSDGAYLYCSAKLNEILKRDLSAKRFKHLLLRHDESAENGYAHFIRNENLLDDNEILSMSFITQRVLQSINYKAIAAQRRENYLFLNAGLKHINKVKFKLGKGSVPLVFPFYSRNANLRNELTKNRIYTAAYWNPLIKPTSKENIEYDYSRNLIHLPVDQRLTKSQLSFIIKIVKNEHQR